uniref:Uncharacterized protein n=1 Tax=Rhizophora mucronata TaxID=61149 RepID=A0A2P2JM25_RHIMU
MVPMSLSRKIRLIKRCGKRHLYTIWFTLQPFWQPLSPSILIYLGAYWQLEFSLSLERVILWHSLRTESTLPWLHLADLHLLLPGEACFSKGRTCSDGAMTGFYRFHKTMPLGFGKCWRNI